MGDVICSCKLEIDAMKADIALLKSHHEECEVWRSSFHADLKEIIELLHQVKSALKLLIALGNVVKWVATVGGAITGGWYLMGRL